MTDYHGEQHSPTDSEEEHVKFIRESSILGNIDCFPEFDVPSPIIYDDGHVNKRIQSWVNKDLHLFPDKVQDRSSGDDQSSSKSRTKCSKTTKPHRKLKTVLKKNKNSLGNTEIATFKITKSNVHVKKPEIKSQRDKVKNSKTLLTKKATKTKTSYKSLVRKLSNKATGCEFMRASVSNYKTNLVKPIEDTKDQTIMQHTAPKPVS